MKRVGRRVALGLFAWTICRDGHGEPFLTSRAPTRSVTTDRWEGEDSSFVERAPLVPSLFPSFNLTKESDVHTMAAVIEATLDESSRIVDVKCLRSAARSKLLYLLAYLNKEETKATAQVLPRQRDGRMRLRVIRDCPVSEDEDPEVFRVGSSTNGTALASAVSWRLRFVPSMQRSRANTVRLELFGSRAAEVVMDAVELVQCATGREICMVVNFSGNDEDRPVVAASISAT
ncbi:Uncharacterized protein SCF082_LOCUS45742 [Durusdinium trenchii]|uniref:Uncharacterized protein n=1 Tax=Durusdinium trenchii TaxID=1381693 RepID=A0ABP0RAA7_9DINO